MLGSPPFVSEDRGHREVESQPPHHHWAGGQVARLSSPLCPRLPVPVASELGRKPEPLRQSRGGGERTLVTRSEPQVRLRLMREPC